MKFHIESLIVWKIGENRRYFGIANLIGDVSFVSPPTIENWEKNHRNIYEILVIFFVNISEKSIGRTHPLDLWTNS